MFFKILLILIFGSVALGSSLVLPKIHFWRSKLLQEVNVLRAENEVLMAEIAERQSAQQPLLAVVYSTYPFNNRHEITVTAGLADGVKIGMPVAVGSAFFGRVKDVFENYSVIQTIFDKDWKSAVRVGAGGVDALLIGGQEPRLAMVDKMASFKEGDKVYTASQGFPYGTLIGSVAAVSDNPTGVWQEAILELPYRFNELREVSILLDYHERQ